MSNPVCEWPQAVSLHIWGGPLTATCAAAFDDMVVVMPMTKTLGRPIPVKAQWKAHSGGVSALHRSSFSIQLYTGGGDGKAHTCAPPLGPIRHMLHILHLLMLRASSYSCGHKETEVTVTVTRR